METVKKLLGRTPVILALLAATVVFTIGASAQHLIITDSTTISGTGTIKLAGNLVDSANSAKTVGGVLQFTGSNKNQAIGSGKANGITISTLVMAGSTDTASLNQNITADTVAVDSGVLAVNGKTFTVSGTTTHSGGSLSANGGSDAVIYNATTGSQAVIDATYHVLTISGGAAKNLLGVTSAGTVTHTGGGLTVNNNFNVTTAGSFTTITDVTGISALQFTGGGANSIGTVTNISSANGAITNNATTALGITTLDGNAGTVTAGNGDLNITTATNGSGSITTGAGGKNLAFGKLLGNTGTIQTTGAGTVSITDTAVNGSGGKIQSTGSGSVTFNGVSTTNGGTISSSNGPVTFASNTSGSVNNTGGTIQLTGSASAYYNADFTGGQQGTFSYAAASTVIDTGATTKVDTAIYGNLRLGGTSDKIASKGVILQGNLALGKNLKMNSGDTLVMSATTPINISGTNLVTGAVRRTNAFAANTFYAFNGDSVGLGVDTALATPSITLNNVPDTLIGTVPGSKYAKHTYFFSGSGLGTAKLAEVGLAYTNAELVGVTTESKLGAKSYNGSAWSKINNPGSTYVRTVDTTNNIVFLSGVMSPLTGVTELAVSAVATQSIASGNWSAAVWDDVTPGAGDDVELYNLVTNDNSSQAASTITLYGTSKLTVQNGLTVSGLVDINSGSANVTVNASQTLTINVGNNVGLHANGTITNNGTIDIK